MQIYLVRHAEARSNVPDPENHPFLEAVAKYETEDPSLTALGRHQADLTGKALASVEFDAILSSPLHRQIATAAAIAGYQKKCRKIELVNDLFELGVTDYPCIPTELLQSLYPQAEIAAPSDPDPSGSKKTYGYEEMLTPIPLTERARRVERYLTRRFKNNETVLVVSSGDFMGHYLIPAILRLPDEVIRQRVEFHCNNCAITQIILNDDGIHSSCAKVNDISHLNA